jgi:hypothetical protein
VIFKDVLIQPTNLQAGVHHSFGDLTATVVHDSLVGDT